MPIRQAEAGGSVVNNCIRCEGSAFRKGTALLLVSLPADSTTVAFFLVKYNENRGGAQQKKPSKRSRAMKMVYFPVIWGEKEHFSPAR